MTSNVGHQEYDENLLASAPVATKAQLQSGYNPDLLVEKVTPPPSRSGPDLEARGISPVERTDFKQPLPPKVPFYRTRKGIIIIVVALVVVFAVAVGGGVAGSKKPANQTKAISPSAISTSKTTSTMEGGAGFTQGGGADSSTSAISGSPVQVGPTATPVPSSSTGPGNPFPFSTLPIQTAHD